MENPAFDDLSQVTQTVDFAYDEIDRRVFGKSNDVPDAVEMTLECQRRVWHWVYQPPMKDMDGFFIRSILCCWIFVPQLRSYSMTEISGRFGKKKQSLERWMSDFKREFPEITKHLQHVLNHE